MPPGLLTTYLGIYFVLQNYSTFYELSNVRRVEINTTISGSAITESTRREKRRWVLPQKQCRDATRHLGRHCSPSSRLAPNISPSSPLSFTTSDRIGFFLHCTLTSSISDIALPFKMMVACRKTNRNVQTALSASRSLTRLSARTV